MSDTQNIGPQGPIGPQGQMGPAGTTGADGQAGVAGADGVAGAAGAAGPAGPPNDPRTPQGYTAADLQGSPTLQQHLLIGLYASLSTMVTTVTNFGDKVTELTLATKNVHDEVQVVDDRRKRDRVVTGFLVAVLLVVVIGTSLVVKGNHDQLAILQKATSPEAVAAQAEGTRKIVLQIDCNGEENNRQLLTAVTALAKVPVPPTRDECKQFLDTPGG